MFQIGDTREQKPILGQDHGEGTGMSYYVIAVVRKDSTLTLRTLKGARSCHAGVTTMAGWTVPVGYLLKQGIIQWNKQCDPNKMMGNFFAASCIPGGYLHFHKTSFEQEVPLIKWTLQTIHTFT